jgi:polyisoprenoid-binding protein YceI
MRMFSTVGCLAMAAIASARADAPATTTSAATTTTAAPTSVPVPAAAKTYTLDPKKGMLFVIVKNDPSSLLSGLAHDHAIGATGWTGSVTWPSDGTSACAIDISVPVSGLEVDLPGYREKAGLDGQEVSVEDKAKIKENFSGGRQLDAKNYPNITFKGTSCKGAGTAFMVEGDMTLRGVTKKVIVPMTIKTDGTTFSASGKFTLRGSDYGMSPFSAVGGTLRNQDSLTFVIDAKN